MTKSTIRSNLSTFNSDIAAVRAKGLDYVLGETNSYSCHVCDPLGSLYVPFAHRFIFFLPGCTRCEQHCWRCTVDVRLPTLRVCAHSFVLRIQHITPAYRRSQIGISRVFFHQGIGFKYSLVCVTVRLLLSTSSKFRKPRFNQQLYTVRHSMGQPYPNHSHRTSKLNTMLRLSQPKQSVTLEERVL